MGSDISNIPVLCTTYEASSPDTLKATKFNYTAIFRNPRMMHPFLVYASEPVRMPAPNELFAALQAAYSGDMPLPSESSQPANIVSSQHANIVMSGHGIGTYGDVALIGTLCTKRSMDCA